MIVTEDNFLEAINYLDAQPDLVFDCETYGLRLDHGDRLFSIIVGTAEQIYYFNFHPYPDLDPRFVLDRHYINDVAKILRSRRRLIGHNIKFDLGMVELSGFYGMQGPELYDTKVGARVEFNDQFDYSLGAVAERIGSEKLGIVEEHIKENRLYEDQPDGTKKPRYDLVPFDIIVPYGEQDVRATGLVERHQRAHFDANPDLTPVVANELALTPVVYDMERRGVLIDQDYCERAMAHERQAMELATEAFETLVGVPFLDSGVYFAKHMKPSGMLSKKTKRSSYCAEALERMAGWGDEAAKTILAYRDAKKRLDLYQGLLYHSDSSATLHASFDQAGTKTGRFSCSSPNLQQLSKTDATDEASLPVRRAIRPRPGYVFVMLDFDQQEYRLMLDYARLYVPHSELVDKVLAGLDVHQATADLAGVSRREAKTVNFSILFGAGALLLGSRLGISEQEARRLKSKVLDAEPGIRFFLDACERTARARGYVHNWLGRRWHCTDPRYAYRAPNFIAQGGGADVVKVAMVRLGPKILEERLDAHLVLQIHDELVLEVRQDQALEAAKLARSVMEAVYPYRYLPLTVGVEWSARSLADKEKLVL